MKSPRIVKEGQMFGPGLIELSLPCGINIWGRVCTALQLKWHISFKQYFCYYKGCTLSFITKFRQKLLNFTHGEKEQIISYIPIVVCFWEFYSFYSLAKSDFSSLTSISLFQPEVCNWLLIVLPVLIDSRLSSQDHCRA